MRRTEGNAFVVLCLLVAVTGGCAGTEGIPGSVALRMCWEVDSDEICVTGSVARYLDGREAKIDPARVRQMREMIETLIRDVPEGIYRTPSRFSRRHAYSLEINAHGRHLVYFLGCSDAVWSPPEPLWKLVTLIEDSFPANEADRKQELSKIISGLARPIEPSKLKVATLDFILDFISGYSDVRVDVDWDELKSYGVDKDLKVHVEAESTTVERFLRRVLSVVNEAAHSDITATVQSSGVLIGPGSLAEMARRAKGVSPVSGRRELVVLHIINSGVGNFAMSVGGDGMYLYGERRKTIPKVPRFSGRELDGFREKVRRVLDTVPSGHYRSPWGHEFVLEIPVEGGSRLYVLTSLATDPQMPEELVQLWGAMNGLCAW
jgi:hypothetical protein